MGTESRKHLLKSEVGISDAELFRKARAEYGELMNLCREIIREVDDTYPIIFRRAKRIILSILKQMKQNPYMVNMTLYGTLDNYLYSHSANITLLSLCLGSHSGLDEKALIELGIAGIMHDTGMTKFLPLVKKDRELTGHEMEIIKEHVSLSCENVEKIADMDYSFREGILETVSHSHERYNGEGYPDGLREDEISLKSRIMSMADAYEAMTHFRPWRETLDHHGAMRNIIETEAPLFDPMLIKKFTSAITIYPPGTLLKLSDGTVAEVVKINREIFTKPIVKVVLDENFRRIKPYLLDLKDNKLLSVDRVVGYRELREKNLRFKGYLELSRIWVNWD